MKDIDFVKLQIMHTDLFLRMTGGNLSQSWYVKMLHFSNKVDLIGIKHYSKQKFWPLARKAIKQ